MKKRIRVWLLNIVIKHLFKGVVIDDIITVDKNGYVFLNKKLITDEEKRMLKSEAKQLQDTRLWDLLTKTPAHHAEEVMFKKATSYDDMIMGKMILYTVDIQNKIIEKLLTV